MKKILTIIIVTLALCVPLVFLRSAGDDMYSRLSGRILLAVEQNGEAWYMNPTDLKRYFLGRPDDAYDLMKKFGQGITDKDLKKIPVGLIENNLTDLDNDGLSDPLEHSLGTDPKKSDTDADNYDDKTEIIYGYNPTGTGRLGWDKNYAASRRGRIFLQVENRGQAWYVNPADAKRYFLSRPADAFLIMQKLGLGITDNNLNLIVTGQIQTNNQIPSNLPVYTPPTIPVIPYQPPASSDADQVFSAAAAAIRSGNTTEAKAYFSPAMEKAIDYTMNFLDQEGQFTLGNIMSGAKLTSSTDNAKVYSTEVYFSLGGYPVTVNFKVAKQGDGSWKLTNL